MKTQNKYIVIMAIALSVMASCKTSLIEEPVKKGSADFTTYVAIGNSLTAGYADGALSKYGQMNSYPVMLANQFKQVGGGEFKVPYMNDGNGNDGNGNPRRVLGYVMPCNATQVSLSPILAVGGATAFNNVSAQGPYNLVGVPGARAVDATFPLYSAVNPYLNRYCQTPGVSTMLSEAVRKKPTFFSLWLGSNDALLYATGGAVDSPNPFAAQLVDTALVRQSITLIVDSLTRSGAKGVIANVPDVTSIPYFTTVPWNSIVLTKGKADTLNALYASVGLTSITWKEGANGIMIVDSTAGATSMYMRHATTDDLILLTTPGDSIKCAQWGVNPMKPLRDQYVLDKTEKTRIQDYIIEYNKSIRDIALTRNLAFVDMYAYLKTVSKGLVYNGITYNAQFISGGAFSLDGVHPNPRGYALIANEFIKAINSKFGATIPSVDPSKYDGIIFP